MTVSPVTDKEKVITRLENQVLALAAAQRQTLETLIELGKMTGALSPQRREQLTGQLIALRDLRPKN